MPDEIIQALHQALPNQHLENPFYLQPLAKPKENCWFANKALGHNTVQGFRDHIVQEMCRSTGIVGFMMNHSLQAIAATQLLQADGKQLIMERTGHKSGVKSCKHSSVQQQSALSDIMNLSARLPKGVNMATSNQQQ